MQGRSHRKTTTWLASARGLAPLIAKWRDVGEQERRLPQPLFEAIRATGTLRLMLPRAFGGAQASLETRVRVIEEFSRQDGSVGWNVMIASLGGALADYLPEAGASEVFASPDDVAVGALASSGRAVPIPGGYRLSGRWAFASGCQNATWIYAGAKVGKENNEARKILFMRNSECQILETWHTTGMRGTGSNDFAVEDVFVPEVLSFSFSDLLSAPAERPSRGRLQPFAQLAGPVMAAVSLGIGRNAIDSFKTLARTKTPTGASTLLAAQHTAHLSLGQAEAILGSARAYLLEIVREVDMATDQTFERNEELTASVRLASAHAAKSAVEAVDLMYEAAGGSSIYISSPLERCFRDVHMITHNVVVAPSNIGMVGQYLLGYGLPRRR